MLNRINRSEVLAAITVGVIGVIIIWIGTGYSYGTARRMGPGFMPMFVGGLLILFAVGLVIEALRAEPSPMDFQLRPFILIMLSIPAFAILMERAGLVPATVSLIVLSAMAERPIRPLRTLVLATVVSALGVGIFIYALNLPLSPLHW